MKLNENELEQVIENWEYWCPDKKCRNRTYSVAISHEGGFFVSRNQSGIEKYITVCVLKCIRCGTPLIIGTNTYHSDKEGWDVKGSTYTRSEGRMLAAATISSGSPPPRHPKEYIAFTEPVSERDLPEKLPKKIVESFREAEYGISKNKPISAAATIRNTIRLIVESEKIESEHLNEAVKKLPFNKEFIDALGKMKIMGDDSLHYEEYEISELTPALDVLHLALEDYYAHIDRLAKLDKAVGDKASKKGRLSTG